MKVEGPNRVRFVPTEGVGQVKEKAAERAPAPGEKVQLSNLGKLLSEARRGPDAPDTARVERLKSEIHNGTFKVDAERIAQAIIDEES